MLRLFVAAIVLLLLTCGSPCYSARVAARLPLSVNSNHRADVAVAAVSL